MNQKDTVIQAIERGPFIDQGQSMNIYMKTPDFEKLTNCHFYSWMKGGKTGLYYLRSQPAVDPIKFGLDESVKKSIIAKRGLLFNDADDIDKNDDDNDNEVLNINDPRRINEIDMNQNKKTYRFRRPTNIDDCEMCGS